MNYRMPLFAALLSFMLAGNAHADKYAETTQMFKDAGQPAEFFNSAYAYVIFPTIGKGGIGIGGAYGEGRVYRQGEYVGDTEMGQVTIGFQLGAQAYSEVIFLEDKRAFDTFTSGSFEFGAEASAVALTAGANVKAGTTGQTAGASGGKNNSENRGKYYRGMAVFTIAKGGLMYEASIGGQKFNYKPR